MKGRRSCLSFFHSFLFFRRDRETKISSTSGKRGPSFNLYPLMKGSLFLFFSFSILLPLTSSRSTTTSFGGRSSSSSRDLSGLLVVLELECTYTRCTTGWIDAWREDEEF
ncbi:hypothetical protein CSUI_006994 [Cystoisospora suis]|uniref:Uncharacterized protein n=1 Tax=Cystoisospora suis TaxID=483139 RepID=A0A2C6KRK2_9APIC|nr:hypothetical protein CSUI_006994 [Cystoisospora suis]